MIGTTPFDESAPRAAPPPVTGAAFGVRTNALDQTCDDLKRAVDRGRQLLEHPGRVRGRAQDGGDDDLRDAVVLFAARWQWGLQVLVDDAAALARDLQVAARVYDQVERMSIPVLPSTAPGPVTW
jgi:hypothetical protein